MVKVLNEHFVCMEYDPSQHGGEVPVEKYPGLKYIAGAWNGSPWTRVSFGLQWVVEPEGRYPLSIATQVIDTPFSKTLEIALQRMIEIRKHPRGSAGEKAAIQRVQDELEEQAAGRTNNDPYLRTKAIFATAVGDLKKRFPGVLAYPDPKIRARAAELVGMYAERENESCFRPGGRLDFFGEAVARCLDDEAPEVRSQAARSMHQIFARPAPEGGTDVLLASAKELWAQGSAAPMAPASEDGSGQ